MMGSIPSRGNLTVLVAEDDDLTAELVTAVLQRTSCRVLRARDGETALRLICQERLHLVVLDLVMPLQNGLDVLRVLQKEPARSAYRVMVLTAHGEDGTEAEARRCGADDFLAKPFDPAELAARVRRLLPPQAALA